MKRIPSTKRIALYLPYQGFKPNYQDGGSKMLELHFVTVEGTQVRNISDYDESVADFDDLTFIAYARWEDYERKPIWEVSSGDIEFRQCYSVDRRDLVRMTRMFKRLDKIQFVIPPQTFGQYVAMVLAGLKVKTVVTALSNNSWHTETSHNITDTKYVAESVDKLVEEFKFRARPDLKEKAEMEARRLDCSTCRGMEAGDAECSWCGRLVSAEDLPVRSLEEMAADSAEVAA